MHKRGVLLGLVAELALFSGIVTWLISRAEVTGPYAMNVDVRIVYTNPFFWAFAVFLFGVVYGIDATLLH
jgi:hypothetical protein